MEVKIGNKRLVLTHLGSAHTRGDVLVHVPADRVLYTGDLLFVGGHPVIWAGPVENWIKACDYILGLDVEVIVAGHGPIADKAAVRELRSYFEYISAQARMHFDNGVPYEEAARKISLDRFAGRAGVGHRWFKDDPSCQVPFRYCSLLPGRHRSTVDDSLHSR
jgi:cyclase